MKSKIFGAKKYVLNTRKTEINNIETLPTKMLSQLTTTSLQITPFAFGFAPYAIPIRIALSHRSTT